MSETPPRPARTGTHIPKSWNKSLLERLTAFLTREPGDRHQLLDVLQNAHERDLLDADALSMMEGVLQVSELRARDIMVPRMRMDVVDISDPIETIVRYAIETAHSRFPVIEGDRDRVIGVLLAKDLLRFYTDRSFDLRATVRPVVYIPESKPLNVLLRDFRNNRNHLAIVVDEHGGVAGLITIEDVLEQIVGDIEDEYDREEEQDRIVAEQDGRFRVRAVTTVEQFNEAFGTQLSGDSSDTIGGLVAERAGHIPRRGEFIVLDNLRLEVLRADARCVQVFMVERLPFAEDAHLEHD